MSLVKTVAYPSLAGYPWVGVSQYSLCVPSGFGVRPGSEMSMSHLFPRGVLAASTLVGGGSIDREAGARAMCEPWLLFCSVVNTSPWEQKLLGEKP